MSSSMKRALRIHRSGWRRLTRSAERGRSATTRRVSYLFRPVERMALARPDLSAIEAGPLLKSGPGAVNVLAQTVRQL